MQVQYSIPNTNRDTVTTWIFIIQSTFDDFKCTWESHTAESGIHIYDNGRNISKHDDIFSFPSLTWYHNKMFLLQKANRASWAIYF